MKTMATPEPIAAIREWADNVLAKVERVCRRHGITSLDAFLGSCRRFAAEKTLNIAVFGRFKAGKSSFLNQLLGRPVLPVGVIPVTSIVTEIEWGPGERAEVWRVDGTVKEVPIERVSEYISESENPGNQKGVERVRIELPALARFGRIRFVDTPGLESVFAHNTGASLDWLPNVGLALVAVGVDPPLSQNDVELIRKLSRYTPNISLLLTKVDLLEEDEREQVVQFIQKQLGRYWDGGLRIFPYSVKPGFERLREELVASLVAQANGAAGNQWAGVLAHKLDSLVEECAAYLQVALKAAEVADTEKGELRRKILGEAGGVEDTRLTLKLIVKHAAGGTRAAFEELLRPAEAPVRARLHARLREEMPRWMHSLSSAAEGFQHWMRTNLELEMDELSKQHRELFLEPVERVSRQLSQTLQDFRNRLSERVLAALGAPLHTTEMELTAPEPKSPDVRVGKIFDRNWEMLSWLIPVVLIKGILKSHFHRKVDYLVYINLSRLASQWEEAVNGTLLALERESVERLDALVHTVEQLTAAAGEQAPRIRDDLEELEKLRALIVGWRRPQS
jgi:GTP-binding protein EngB required for normal cell division